MALAHDQNRTIKEQIRIPGPRSYQGAQRCVPPRLIAQDPKTGTRFEHQALAAVNVVDGVVLISEEQETAVGSQRRKSRTSTNSRTRASFIANLQGLRRHLFGIFGDGENLLHPALELGGKFGRLRPSSWVSSSDLDE